MSTANPKPNTWKWLAFGIIPLIVGAFIGAAATRYAERSASPLQKAKLDTTMSMKQWDLDWPTLAATNHWDPFQEMHRIRMQMNELLQGSLDRLRADSKSPSFVADTGYSSALDVRDMKDHYEVHAYLPNSDTSDAQVSLNGNQLKVEVTNKTTDTEKMKHEEAQITEWGQYDQVVQLPGKVDSGNMKVVRKDHELLITIPKMS